MKKINTKDMAALYQAGNKAYKECSAYKRLEAALAEAQKGAKARTITVEDILDDVEYVLNKYKVIGKVALKGTTYSADVYAQTFAGCYNGVPYSTHYDAEIGGNGAVTITCIGRRICTAHAHRVRLSDTAKDKLVSRYQDF